MLRQTRRQQRPRHHQNYCRLPWPCSLGPKALSTATLMTNNNNKKKKKKEHPPNHYLDNRDVETVEPAVIEGRALKAELDRYLDEEANGDDDDEYFDVKCHVEGESKYLAQRLDKKASTCTLQDVCEYEYDVYVRLRLQVRRLADLEEEEERRCQDGPDDGEEEEGEEDEDEDEDEQGDNRSCSGSSSSSSSSSSTNNTDDSDGEGAEEDEDERGEEEAATSQGTGNNIGDSRDGGNDYGRGEEEEEEEEEDDSVVAATAVAGSEERNVSRGGHNDSRRQEEASSGGNSKQENEHGKSAGVMEHSESSSSAAGKSKPHGSIHGDDGEDNDPGDVEDNQKDDDDDDDDERGSVEEEHTIARDMKEEYGHYPDTTLSWNGRMTSLNLTYLVHKMREDRFVEIQAFDEEKIPDNLKIPLTEDIALLDQLKTLSVGPYFSSLPRSMKYLTKLEDLTISGCNNNFTVQPGSLSELRKVTKLAFSNSTGRPISQFFDLTNLKDISFSLSDYQPGAFDGAAAAVSAANDVEEFITVLCGGDLGTELEARKLGQGPLQSAAGAQEKSYGNQTGSHSDHKNHCCFTESLEMVSFCTFPSLYIRQYEETNITAQNIGSILAKVPKAFPNLTTIVIRDRTLTFKKIGEGVRLLATAAQPSSIDVRGNDQLDSSEKTTTTGNNNINDQPWVCTSPFLNQILFLRTRHLSDNVCTKTADGLRILLRLLDFFPRVTDVGPRIGQGYDRSYTSSLVRDVIRILNNDNGDEDGEVGMIHMILELQNRYIPGYKPRPHVGVWNEAITKPQLERLIEAGCDLEKNPVVEKYVKARQQVVVKLNLNDIGRILLKPGVSSTSNNGTKVLRRSTRTKRTFGSSDSPFPSPRLVIPLSVWPKVIRRASRRLPAYTKSGLSVRDHRLKNQAKLTDEFKEWKATSIYFLLRQGLFQQSEWPPQSFPPPSPLPSSSSRVPIRSKKKQRRRR